MSDSSNSYTANAFQVQVSAEAIDQISLAARRILLNFAGDVSGTRSWPGVDDSFCKSAGPQEKKETETVSSTTQTLSEAIVAVATGTNNNAQNILKTQATHLEAIQAAGNASTANSGRH
ncbi:hypothetical protein ACFYWX_33955 [Streptomyces sp. NPDC002888]|uniref:hypothetical protein n=1 Tax=Streptomyces sp. NPDC002888 TaxID=3364668 RepID=UPI0036C55582